MQVAISIELTDERRARLAKYNRGHWTPVLLMKPSMVVLLTPEGKTKVKIAEEEGIACVPVGTWRNRFVQKRLARINQDAPRPGAAVFDCRSHEEL